MLGDQPLHCCPTPQLRPAVDRLVDLGFDHSGDEEVPEQNHEGKGTVLAAKAVEHKAKAVVLHSDLGR